MRFDSISTRSTIVASILATHVIADSITLSQFQRITQFPRACTEAYNTPISGCTSNDFINGNPCSRACVAGLEEETALLNTACLGIQTSSSTLIGLFFKGKGVDALCPKIASPATSTIFPAPPATTSIESSTSSTAAAAATSSSSSQQAQSSSSSSVAASSSTTSSTSSSASDSSSTSTTSSSSAEPSTSSSSSSSLSSSSDSSTSTASAEPSTSSSTLSTLSSQTSSSTTASVQTSINIPLISSATATPTAGGNGGGNFGGEIGNLNGPTGGASSLYLSSTSISLATALLIGFLISV